MPLMIDNMATPSQPVARTVGGFPHGVVFDWRAKYAARELTHNYLLSNTRATARTIIMNGQVLTVAAQKPAFSNSSGGAKLSVEPAATNLITYSNGFNSWDVLSASASVADQGDGTWSLTDNATGSSHSIYQGAKTIGTGNPAVFTIYAKAGTADYLWLAEAGGAWDRVRFNLVTGEVAAQEGVASGKITSLGDGWYRCALVISSMIQDGFTPWLAVSELDSFSGYVGTGKYIYIRYAQLEAGTVPSAYIPTTTAAVSRAADANGFSLPQALKNLLSTEQPTPTPVLTQTAGAIVLATVAGGALAMPVDGSAADLSAYTGYVLKVTDSAGKTAWARIAAPGTGLALGSELIANQTFDAGTGSWSGGDATIASVAAGQSNNCLEITRTGAQPRAYQNVAGLVQGNLYRLSAYNKQGTSGALEARVALLKSDGSTYEFYNSDTAPTDWAERVAYGTVTEATGARYVRLIQNDASAGTMLFDEASLTQVTSPPTTGVWLESTPGAGDNTWAYIQSGFNPNSISTWSVIPASQWRAEGTLVIKGVVFGVSKDDMVAGQNISFIACQDAAASVLYLYRGFTAASLYAQGTGANAYAAVTINQSSNTPYDFTVHWSSTTNLMQVGYKLSSASTWTWGPVGTFGGTFTLGSTLWIGYSPSYPFQVGRITIHNSWLNDPE